MKIVCLGDSLTYAYGVKRRNAWTSLASELSGDLYINKGVNGDTTGGMLSRFYEDVLIENPKAVFLMGGANDFIMGEPVSRVKANMSSMVYQSLGRRILPIIGVGIDVHEDMVNSEWRNFTDFSLVRSKLGQYREWVKSFAEVFGIDYIDAYGLLKERDNDSSRDLYLDGLHLNVEGNRVMAAIIAEEISRLTKK